MASDRARSFADYSKMIKLNSNNALGYRLRGVLFLVLGRDSEAEPLTRYLQLRPDETMATSEEIFRDAMALPADARAEITERLVERFAQDVSPAIASEQL